MPKDAVFVTEYLEDSTSVQEANNWDLKENLTKSINDENTEIKTKSLIEECYAQFSDLSVYNNDNLFHSDKQICLYDVFKSDNQVQDTGHQIHKAEASGLVEPFKLCQQDDQAMLSSNQDITTSDHNIPTSDQDIQTCDQDIPTIDHNILTIGPDIRTSDQNIPKSDKDIPSGDQDIPTSDKDVPTSDQDVPTSDQDIATSDKDIATSDQDIRTGDQDIRTGDQDIPTIDHNILTIDPDIRTSDQNIPNSNQDTPTIDEAIQSSDQDKPTSDEAIQSSDQDKPTSDKDIPTSDQDIPTINSAILTSDQLLISMQSRPTSEPFQTNVSFQSPGATATSKTVESKTKAKKENMIEILNCIQNIISIIDNLFLMNDYLTKTITDLIQGQQKIQLFINFVYEHVTSLEFTNSLYITVSNEYSINKGKFNVKLFGEGVLRSLKKIKKDLNVNFRQFNGFRKDFRYISRTLVLIPFENLLNQEIKNESNKCIEVYFKICRLFNTKEKFEIVEKSLNEEFTRVLKRVKKFKGYLSVLKETTSNERLV